MTRDNVQHLGDLLYSSRQKGTFGLPLLSVTLHNGLVIRDLLDRRTETNIDAEDHLLVKEGYIAYNMMRVWQGALGRAHVDGLVSPAYIVLKPTEGIDSKFTEYLFKTPRMIYLFWAYSYGLTKDRLRLYYKDFARIPVDIPSVSEQQKIAKILSTWDKAISTTEALIDNSKQQKKALMQQLLTGKKRFAGFEGEWEEVKLSTIVKVTGGNAFKSEDFKEKGIPLVKISNIKADYSVCVKSAVFIYEERKYDKFQIKNGDVLIAMSGATTGKIGCYQSDKLAYLNQRVGRFDVKEGRTTKAYLFQLLKLPKIQHEILIDAVGGAQPNINNKDIERIEVRIPLVYEQDKIASVLTNADKEIELLEQQLADLKQEKKALMQQLLTGKRRVKVSI